MLVQVCKFMNLLLDRLDQNMYAFRSNRLSKQNYCTPRQKKSIFQIMRKYYSAEGRNFPFKLLCKSCGAFKGPELLTASIRSTFPSMHAYRILFLNVYTSVGPKPLLAIQRQKDCGGIVIKRGSLE